MTKEYLEKYKRNLSELVKKLQSKESFYVWTDDDLKKVSELTDQIRAEEERIFWEEYLLLSFEERKKVWLRRFYQQRRWQEESIGNRGENPFTPEQVDAIRPFEPQIDEILIYVKEEMNNIWFGEDMYE